MCVAAKQQKCILVVVVHALHPATRIIAGDDPRDRHLCVPLVIAGHHDRPCRLLVVGVARPPVSDDMTAKLMMSTSSATLVSLSPLDFSGFGDLFVPEQQMVHSSATNSRRLSEKH